MKIKIAELHIDGYKSLSEFKMKLNDKNLLIGKNNAGKSSILEAVELTLTYEYINKEDIFISDANPYEENKKVNIDLLIKSTSNYNSFVGTWGSKFGKYIQFDNDDEYFAFRTVLEYDHNLKRYKNQKYVINNWESKSTGDKLSNKILEQLRYYILKTDRDIVTDINLRKSLWNRTTANIDLSDETESKIEQDLKKINDSIKGEIKVYTSLEENLRKALERDESFEILPVTRNVDEMYKGNNIYINKQGITMPIQNLGMGTRNWTVFSTIKTNLEEEQRKNEENYNLLLIEEPEAHIHPQSQQKMFKDILCTQAQKIITTHSPYLLQLIELEDIVHIKNTGVKTECLRLSESFFEKSNVDEIKRYIIGGNGDLFFSNLIVLYEGETENQMLPVLFKKKFGGYPFEFGVNFIKVNGRKYDPFLKFCKELGIEWLILSDNERDTNEKVNRILRKEFGEKAEENLENVCFHPENCSLEGAMIVEKETVEIIKGVLDLTHPDEVDGYKKKDRGKSDEKYDSLKDKHTLNGEEEELRAIYHVLLGSKAKGAYSIAEALAECPEKHWPDAINELFDKIEKKVR